jgi:hypothetical protein
VKVRKTSVAVLPARAADLTTIATIGMLILLAALLLPHPTAAAGKIASGSNCSSSWVNNAGAMSCFIQGEDEAHAGVVHPHYVACAGGDIFCCVDDSHGNQNCEAQASTAGGNRASEAQKVQAILMAQRAMLKSLGKPASKIDGLQSRMPVQNRAGAH